MYINVMQVVAKLSGVDSFVTALVVCERRRSVFRVSIIHLQILFIFSVNILYHIAIPHSKERIQISPQHSYLYRNYYMWMFQPYIQGVKSLQIFYIIMGINKNSTSENNSFTVQYPTVWSPANVAWVPIVLQIWHCMMFSCGAISGWRCTARVVTVH